VLKCLPACTSKKAKLFQDRYLLQNRQQYSWQMMQAKQQELMQPHHAKAVNAY